MHNPRPLFFPHLIAFLSSFLLPQIEANLFTAEIETITDEQLILYHIFCPDSIIGSVIGKGGKVINLSPFLFRRRQGHRHWMIGRGSLWHTGERPMTRLLKGDGNTHYEGGLSG